MRLNLSEIYYSLNFLSESIRLQYTNFIWRHLDRFNEFLSFGDAVYRIKLGEPIEYVFNLAEFCEFNFYVDKRTLIPRIETEEIVEEAAEFILQNHYEKYTIIDIGTGSGCIILSIAKSLDEKEFLKNHKLIGIDTSKVALEVAEINRNTFHLNNDVELIHSSFEDFDFSKYENLIICANLPYIPNDERLQKSVADYEPHSALFGGEKGDELNNQLLEKLKKHPSIKKIIYEGHNGAITIV